MKKEKEQIQDPDIEAFARLNAAELKVGKAGKVKVRSYSKTSSSEYHNSLRKNVKDEINDGDYFQDIEIKTIRQVSLTFSREDQED